MQKLVTTKEAAEIFGLSLQGIHYRIKKNQLKSISKDGKLFVYIDEKDIEENSKKNSQIAKETTIINNDFEIVLKSKDEQISLLKKSLKYFRKQHNIEIERLENSQKRVIEVFNSEIKLLQSAFNEMRSIYKPQIKEQKIKSEFITIKEFFIIMKRANKSDKTIKETIFNAIKNGDKRFIYNKTDKKLLILNDSFEDFS